eukprot:Em0001g1088a
MADVGLGSIELVVEDDSINKYYVKKSHDESHLNETDRKQATNAGVDSFNIIKALLPLLDSRKKDLVNEEKRAGNVLERAFLKLGLQSEEQYPTPGNAEVRTESSWNAYVEGIVLGCGDAFWMKVAQKTRSQNVGKLDAIIEVLVDSIADTQGGIDETLLWVLKQDEMPEFFIETLVKHLLQRTVNMLAIDPSRNTPLHLAAKRGFENVVKQLLEHDSPLLACNSEGKTPLELAIEMQHNEVAVVIIKRMEPGRVRALFECKLNQPSQLKLHELIERNNMQGTTLAVLDCMIEPVINETDTYVIYYGILDGDIEGRPPSHPDFDKSHKSCLHIIAKSNNKEIVYHDVIRLLLRRKWKKFARFIYLIQFMCYLLLMASVACALIIAARKPRPDVYDSRIDIFRGICEAFVLLFVGWNGISETRQLIKLKGFYFYDSSNYLDVGAIIFTLLIIPFRIARLDVQWILASLSYLFNCLRAFKYTPVFRSTGAYTQILYKVVLQDVVQFSAVFVVFVVSFSGSLYFALRGEVQSASNDTTGNTTNFTTDLDLYPSDTREYYNVLFTGLRVLIQGNVIGGYYGSNGFGWFAVIVYMVYLFLVGVVMLNLLIAQMADTYGSVQREAQQSLMLNRAWIVARVEHNSFLAQDFRQRFFKSCEVVKNPSEVLEKWEVPPINEVNKRLDKMERAAKRQETLIAELRNTIEKHLQKQEELLQITIEKRLQNQEELLTQLISSVNNATRQL